MSAAARGVGRFATWPAAVGVVWPALALLSVSLLRGAINGHTAPQAFAAGLAFGLGLLAIALVAGWRPGRPRAAGLLIGIGGGAMLVAVPLLFHVARCLAIGARPEPMLAWVAVTVLVASAEEIVLRGVLIDALDRTLGPASAVAVTSLLFGLIHVPLYGWAVLPVDIAAGVWLAGLRRVSASVAAPTVAHVIADLATRWL
jgi:membrane protease YdiL (CAAX protease family)